MTRNLTRGRTHERSNATLEGRTKTWWHDEGVGSYEAFPVLFVYSVWEASNRTIFNNAWEPPDLTIVMLMNKIQEHKINTVTTKKRIIRAPVINSDTPWAFFDGASKGEPRLGGVGVVIHIS